MAQVVLGQFWDGAAWIDLLSYSDEGYSIKRGSDGESGGRPSEFSLTLNNDDGRYRTNDPMSPLYGLAGRNARVRIRLNGVTRTQAEASSWRPAKTPEHKPGQAFGRAWCDLRAEGLQRRISQWRTPLRSAIHRAFTRLTTLSGYWPMEDPSKATQLSNAVAGGQAAILRGGDPGGIEGPGGSDNLLKIDAGMSAVGTFKAMPTTGGWQLSFMAKLLTVPSTGTYWPYMQWWTRNGNRWTMEVNWDSYRWTVIDKDGGLVKQFGASFGTGAEPNQWVIHRIKVTQVGGNVQIEPAWYPELADAIYGVTDSYVGLVDAPTRWRLTQNVWNLDGGFGHLIGVKGVTDNLQAGSITQAFNGFVGEVAASRFSRLLTEENLTGTVVGTVAETAPMGPQRPSTLQDLLKEIRDTEDAFIMDDWATIGLKMFTRRSTMNQAVALALTFPTQVAYPLDEVTDDLGVANIVTVTNSRGAEYTASLDTGPLSTLVPPLGIGEAKASYDVNVADETLQLQQLAEWYLGKSTINRSRYPKVKIDLLAHPELISAVEGVEPSDRITITGLEREVVELIVVGWEERGGHNTRTVEFTCLPADVQHHVGVWDDAASRYDSASTTLAAGTTTTAVTMLLTTVDRADCWSTAETPYACMVAGERVTVTTMTAPAGTGPYTQTATVMRSVNTVVKVHVAGEQFSLADPVYAGL